MIYENEDINNVNEKKSIEPKINEIKEENRK